MSAVCAALAVLLAGSGVPAAPPDETPAGWYAQGEASLKAAIAQVPSTGVARNVILFIGDGMGISTITAARILAGQQNGNRGEENLLSFETFPNVALIKTYNTDMQVPDSAGTMSAMMTGEKTRAGVLGVDENVTPGECTSQSGHELKTLLEEFEESGRASGVVTTTRVTHATPAATYAHTVHRDWESDADMPADAARAGCHDIARQLIEFHAGDGIEVVLGGGRAEFLPEAVADPEYPGKAGRRRDERNLVSEWQKRNPGGAYVWNMAKFAAVDPAVTTRLLGLFEPSHMQYEADRTRDPGGEPSLAEMTAKAIAILAPNAKGFFLMVEGGRIDHAHHSGNAYRALTDTIAFADAVARARELTDSQDTLILVTADHSHAFVMGGHPTRGNPILGKVIENDERGVAQKEPARGKDGLPYTTLGYLNGPHAGRRDISKVDTTRPDYFQEALVPLDAESHSGEDVAAFALGPWAQLVHGVQEQNYLYHVMRYAAGIGR